MYIIYSGLQVFVTPMECSLSIRQQKHKMEENLFCSSVWEKHLAESWCQGERLGGRERKEDGVRERWFISLRIYGFFFFFQSLWILLAEMDHRCAQLVELNFKVPPITWSQNTTGREEIYLSKMLMYVGHTNCFHSHGVKMRCLRCINVFINTPDNTHRERIVSSYS